MLRQVVCLLSFLSVAMSGPLVAQAQDREKPTADERAALAQCIKSKRGTEASEEDCIFLNAAVCMDKPENGSTLCQRICNAREIIIWDELLNSRYQRLRKVVSKDGAQKLKLMQRAWISWRNAKCEMPYILFEGGTLAGPLAAGCTLKATAVRAIELGDALDSMGEKP